MTVLASVRGRHLLCPVDALRFRSSKNIAFVVADKEAAD